MNKLPKGLDLLGIVLLLGASTEATAHAQDFRPELTAVQINDVYRVDAVENGKTGGIGRLVTLVRGIARPGSPPVMVLHAGDAIAPSLESQFFGGQQMIDALNHLNQVAPVVFVPGNHEFDERRPATFVEAVRSSHFPWLAGNLTVSTGDSTIDRSVGGDTVIVTPSGMRIGIFTLTFLDSRRDYARADSAYVAVAERQIRDLERRGAHAIVGLTHLEHEVDRQIARLRRRHPRLVWIAGGHEHYLLRDELTDSTALITKGDSNARRVWRVSLGRRGRRAQVHAEPVALDSTVAIDPVYAREITQKWNARLSERVPFINAVVGRSTTLLDASEETVRNRESTWGNWLADQMRTAFPSIRTDAAVLNGGAIRIDDVFTDTIRWEHLARTFGFPTRVGVVWLRGDKVREMLERSVSGGRGEGRFLQLSGLQARFDRSRPEGARIRELRVQRGEQWVPVEADSVYSVAVPDYLMGGGDGYTFHQSAERTLPPGPELRLIAFEALANAFARGQAIAPRVEGRLVEESNAAGASPHRSGAGAHSPLRGRRDVAFGAAFQVRFRRRIEGLPAIRPFVAQICRACSMNIWCDSLLNSRCMSSCSCSQWRPSSAMRGSPSGSPTAAKVAKVSCDWRIVTMSPTKRKKSLPRIASTASRPKPRSLPMSFLPASPDGSPRVARYCSSIVWCSRMRGR